MAVPRSSERFSLRLGLYVAGTCLLASVLAWLGRIPTDDGLLSRLVVLVGLGILAWNAREINIRRGVSFSFLSIILVASAALVGPAAAALIGAASAAVDVRRIRVSARIFNVGMTAACAAAAGLTYVVAGGIVAPGEPLRPGEIFLRVALPLMAADVVAGMVNALLVAGVLAVDRGVPFVATSRDILLTTGSAYLGYGVIGFILVVLWFPVGLGGFSALLVLIPLLVARWAVLQYVDELTAHESTVTSLVTALETRDKAAAQRGRDAADLARDLATELGMLPGQVTDVTHAALLRELGALATVDGAQRQGAVAEPFLRGIDFLDGARDVLIDVEAAPGMPRDMAEPTAQLVDVVTLATAWARAGADDEAGAITARRLGPHVHPDVRLAFGELAARGRLARPRTQPVVSDSQPGAT